MLQGIGLPLPAYAFHAVKLVLFALGYYYRATKDVTALSAAEDTLAVMKAKLHDGRAGTLEESQMREILIEVEAETILVGWRGLTSAGAEIPYSVPKAIELLGRKDFRDRVIEISKTQENYRRQMVEGAAEQLGKG